MNAAGYAVKRGSSLLELTAIEVVDPRLLSQIGVFELQEIIVVPIRG